LYGFFLEADHAKLVTLLRDVFHRPSGGAVEYYPLSSHVMATFGVIDRITVRVPPFDGMGDVTEPQVALWIPTAAVRREGEVFLKQFRDIADGKTAALQQIVETKMHVKRLKGRPLLNDYAVTIDDFDSQGLRKQLGLVDQTTSFAFQVEMDFVVETGRVLWPG